MNTLFSSPMTLIKSIVFMITRSTNLPHTLTFSIVNLRNNPTLKMAVRIVDSIFHAAGLKQVPSCGFLPMEAVKTNAMSTANALDAAVDANGRWSSIQRLADDGIGV